MDIPLQTNTLLGRQIDHEGLETQNRRFTYF